MAHNLFRTLLSGVLLLTVACNLATPAPTLPPPATQVITPTLPPPTPTPPPDPRSVSTAYLEAWQAGDYAQMYSLLASESRAAYSADAFTQQYQTELEKITAISVKAQLAHLNQTGENAEASAAVEYATALVGTITTSISFTLKSEAGRWGVVFSPALIWPELVNGQQLLMVPLLPERGNIYDRNGIPLVVPDEAYAVGLVPIELGEDSGAIEGVARLLGLNAETLGAQVQSALLNGIGDQYLPLGDVSAAQTRRFEFLFNTSGVKLTAYTDRYYYGSGDAAHVTGYTTFIREEELAAYKTRGYSGSERVGRTGLERWGEDYLRGRAGGQLQLRGADITQFIRMIASTPQMPAQDIYTTLDFELQQAAQFALGEFTGAIVVLNADTGEVLAMASNPTFSPNIFSPGNRNQVLVQALLNDSRTPLINHATQSTYPAGSVFKIVTMSAGLTSGLFTPETRYTCTGEWNETGDVKLAPRKDWLEGGHGDLSLTEGLSASCNPWFYHVGFGLFNKNPDWLPQTARAFGLGQLTNIQHVEEVPGLIPDPEWKRQRGETWGVLDSINSAIGQGDVLVTPLQIARMVAAVGNGGTLYQPQLVWEIRPPEGEATLTFQPIISSTLPLNAEQLDALQIGLLNVMKEPRGTARDKFKGFSLCVAGKTGTAEDGGIFGTQEPDAWFAGYTCENRGNKPDIAIAVALQNRGGGSDFAAPIFRRMVEAYYGLNYTRYPWESAVGVPRVEATATPPAP